MNSQRTILIFGMFLYPVYALASGNEVLFPLLMQLGSIFIFLILLLSIKFGIVDKLILAVSYFMTLAIIFNLTWNVDHTQNRIAVDISWAIGPAAISLITFFILKKKK